MLVACWSAKGGSGTTVVATALTLVLSRPPSADVLLVDLGGDVPAALGVPDPVGPGIGDWLAASAEDDALDRLAVDVVQSVRLLPRGGPLPHSGAGGERLAAALHSRPASIVVVDCGPPAQRWALPSRARRRSRCS